MSTGNRRDKKSWEPMGTWLPPEKIFGYRWVIGTDQIKIDPRLKS